MRPVAPSRSYPATWWLRDDDGNEHRVPGLISFDEANNPLVNLYGSLPGQWNDSFLLDAVNTHVFPLLYGVTMDSHWTLVDSQVESYKRSMGSDIVDVVLRPRFVLAGDFYLQKDELAVTDVTLTLWDQDEWAGWRNSIVITDRNAHEGSILTVSHKPPTPTVAALDGATLSLVDDSWGHALPDANGAVTVSASSAWVLDLNAPTSLDELLSQWIEPLVFMTTSATRRKTGLERMSVGCTKWVMEKTGEPAPGKLRLYAQSGTRPEGPLPEWGLLHRREDWDLKTQLPVLFSFVRAQRSAVDQYLSYRNASGYTWQMRFAILYQIIETLDRTLNPDPPKTEAQLAAVAAIQRVVAGEPDLIPFAEELQTTIEHAQVKSLAQRLSRLDQQASGFLSTELSDKTWKNDLAGLRNIVAHGLEASQELVTDRGPLWTGTQLIELLFEVRILTELGFTPERSATVLRENPRWYGRITALKANLSVINAMIQRAREAQQP